MSKKEWNAKELERLYVLFGKLGSPHEAETEAPREAIHKMLVDHGCLWSDLPELLNEARAQAAPGPAAAPPPPTPPDSEPITALELFTVVKALLETYVAFANPYHYTAVALWVLHTHLFRQFRYTPRLLITSAIRGEGKGAVLDVLESLVPNPERSDSTTGPTVMRLAGDGPTILLDEVDNLNLFDDPVLRGVLNSGYRRGGSASRTINNTPTTFPTFAPIALAGIGTVPLTLMRRSIVIHMQRATPEEVRRLTRFDDADPNQQAEFSTVFHYLQDWAYTRQLADLAKSLADPPMPEELTATQADNWRSLIGCADMCGPETGRIARDAAIELCLGLDEDLEVLLLTDIRDIFDRHRRPGQFVLERQPVNGVGQLATKTILAHLIALPHGLWSDWCGPHGDQTPRALTQGIMAGLLRKFRIKPATLWPTPRNRDAKSAKGYRRSDFEGAWRRYCSPEAGTPSQRGKIRHIRAA
jgi:hypothetical protein